jgi:hypothetical protein
MKLNRKKGGVGKSIISKRSANIKDHIHIIRDLMIHFKDIQHQIEAYGELDIKNYDANVIQYTISLIPILTYVLVNICSNDELIMMFGKENMDIIRDVNKSNIDLVAYIGDMKSFLKQVYSKVIVIHIYNFVKSISIIDTKTRKNEVLEEYENIIALLSVDMVERFERYIKVQSMKKGGAGTVKKVVNAPKKTELAKVFNKAMTMKRIEKTMFAQKTKLQQLPHDILKRELGDPLKKGSLIGAIAGKETAETVDDKLKMKMMKGLCKLSSKSLAIGSVVTKAMTLYMAITYLSSRLSSVALVWYIQHRRLAPSFDNVDYVCDFVSPSKRIELPIVKQRERMDQMKLLQTIFMEKKK